MALMSGVGGTGIDQYGPLNASTLILPLTFGVARP